MPKFFESEVHFFPKKSLARKKCSQSGNSLVQAQGCPFQAKWKLNFNRFQAQLKRRVFAQNYTFSESVFHGLSYGRPVLA